MDFFTPGGAKKVCLKGGRTKGLLAPREAEEPMVNKRRRLDSGTEYVREVMAEEDLQARLSGMKTSDVPRDNVSRMEPWETSTMHIVPLPPVEHDTEEDPSSLYARYNFKERVCGKSLKIEAYKEEILSRVAQNSVTVIVGPTGCGKSTQVPQYILDQAVENGKYCKIVVTQPRRLATRNIAARVCNERNWKCGSICGYKIGLDHCTSPDTRLTFVTEGTLLNTLINERNLTRYTHVIIDEIHERNCDTDFVLLICKLLLRTNSTHLKLILMSATAEGEKFVQYFKTGASSTATLLIIEDPKPKFQVCVSYLRELYNTSDYDINKRFYPNINEIPANLNEAFDFVLHLLLKIELSDKSEERKSVLIFLPGIFEIEELSSLINTTITNTRRGDSQWVVIVLHSSISAEEQQRAFVVRRKIRKIILATNIAESSLTIRDIGFVIDFCLTKVMIVSKNSSLPSLHLQWASKANLTQRAGRVGRVAAGNVYRLIPESMYDELPDYPLPEMLTSPQEQLILRCKLLNFGPPKYILAKALDPPNLFDIERAILNLKMIGGLTFTCCGEDTTEDGDITYLGRLITLLPIDPTLTKLILFGHMFNVFEECCIIAAAVSLGNLFSFKMEEKVHSYGSLVSWSSGTASDHLAMCFVYKTYIQRERLNDWGAFGTPECWARRNLVQLKTLREMKLLIEEILSRLMNNMIAPMKDRVVQNFEITIKLALAGAFYPNYFIRKINSSSELTSEETAVRMLNGRNPNNTVFLSNFPCREFGILYEEALRQTLLSLLNDPVPNKEQMRITFDRGSEKIYLEFRNNQPKAIRMPGEVAFGVYKCVYLRLLRAPITINILPDDMLEKYKSKLLIMEEDTDVLNNLPGVQQNLIHIRVVKSQSPGQFWAAYEEDFTAIAYNVLDKLNYPDALRPLRANETVELNQWYVSLYFGKYSRARVDFINMGQVEVFFIDLGIFHTTDKGKLKKPVDSLQELLDKLPPLVFECRLAGIKPNLYLEDGWCIEANHFFENLVIHKVNHENLKLLGHVFSVVQGIVALNLRWHNSEQFINQIMIERGYAMDAVEGYLSMANREIRQRELDPAEVNFYNRQQKFTPWIRQNKIEPPPPEECKRKVTLKGPFSPLETKYFPVTQVSRGKEVMISAKSVNCVLLDTEPNDPFDRLLITSNVSEVQSGNKLTLHDSTHFQYIPGLPAIICLLFAPRVELRMNPSRTLLISAICGMGVDESNVSLNPDNDIEYLLECHFTPEDIELINKVRESINFLTDVDPNHQYPNIIQRDVWEKGATINHCLRDLFRNREPLLVSYNLETSYKWGADSEQLDVIKKNRASRSLYPPHCVPTLNYNLEALHHQVKCLHKISNGFMDFRPCSCPLCNHTMKTRAELISHVNMEEHRHEVFRVLRVNFDSLEI